MHDLHEANRISIIVLDYFKNNKLTKLNSINIELGTIIEHGEDILPENLEFNLKMILKDIINDETKINIKKVKRDSWKLVSIEGE